MDARLYPAAPYACREAGSVLDVELAVVPADDPLDVELHADPLVGGELGRELEVLGLEKFW